MADQERYEEDPQSEHVMRRDMRDKCDYKHEKTQVESFLNEKLVPALAMFENEIMDAERTKGINYNFSIDYFGNPSYYEKSVDEEGRTIVYAAYSYGMRATIPQGLFYYSFYAMTHSLSPSGPYCVLIKRNGEYYTPDINAVTKEQLLEDVKKAFTDATT